MGASAPVPSHAAIEEAAALIAKAEFPLILTASAGRTPEAMAALTALADEFALPVVQSEARDISLPTDHAMCLGFDPGSVCRQGRRARWCSTARCRGSRARTGCAATPR